MVQNVISPEVEVESLDLNNGMGDPRGVSDVCGSVFPDGL